MNAINGNSTGLNGGNSFKNVNIICPKCQEKKVLSVPKKIINESKQLTTISIPANLCCEHSFQAFIDKNFKIRGYQLVDFAFSAVEYLDKEEEEHAVIPEFEKIINLIRQSVDEKDILGGAILTIDGKVLYSSLPHKTFSSTTREFEVRAKKNLINVQKMFLELENEQKICSQYMEVNNVKFILILVFASTIKLGMGNLLLKELTKKITHLF
ncbi:MAG: hypothetical protein ACFFBP_15670 [Promethearchaeota archaeon]